MPTPRQDRSSRQKKSARTTTPKATGRGSAAPPARPWGGGGAGGRAEGSGGKGEEGTFPLTTNIILGIAAPLFAAALLVFLSGALDELLLGDSLVMMLRYPGVQIVAPRWWAPLGLLVLGL